MIFKLMSFFFRFKKDVGHIAALRGKEKGDWKKSTQEEKKVLHRASFCQTLEEVEAPTGEWKSIANTDPAGHHHCLLLGESGQGPRHLLRAGLQ